MRTRLDIIFASGILLFGVTVSVFAFGKIRETELPSRELPADLVLGKHVYSLVQGDKCVGELRTEFNVEPETLYLLQADIRYSIAGKTSTAKAYLSAFFNVFRQLVVMNSTLEAGEGRLQVKLANPAPIGVIVSYLLRGKEQSQSFEIPGPILLEKSDSTNYRVNYPMWNQSWTTYASAFQSKPLPMLDLRLEPSAYCQGKENLEAVDLDLLSEHVKSMLQDARQLPFLFPFSDTL